MNAAGYLVRDLRADEGSGGRFRGIERRHSECARLYACEDAWIDEHGSAQACCPVGCRGFASRGAPMPETVPAEPMREESCIMAEAGAW